MNRRIPILLITGFLGSGKTSLIGHMLSTLSAKMKIAVVQNEFAASGIDGEVLRANGSNFTLRELNTGSIFCSCLFSKFKEVVVELAEGMELDMLIVEATGIANPIGIAQLFEDDRVAECCYLSRIVTLVDAARFLRGVSTITAARHQVQVADYLLLNKIDLVDEESLRSVEEELLTINPLAHVMRGENGEFPIEDMVEDSAQPVVVSEQIKGDLTRCGGGGFISKIFKTTKPIRVSNLEAFIDSLGADTLRLKGVVVDENRVGYMVQYQPEQCRITRVTGRLIGSTELISIGYRVPNFELLN